jgi:SseB protein N-terminal domain/SseB protein C-terminal domain
LTEPVPGPQNELERELLRPAPAEGDGRHRLTRALAAAEVMVPSPSAEDASDGPLVIPAGGSIELPTWERDGHSIIPAFTSDARLLEAIPEGSSFLRMPLPALWDLAREENGRVVLNPGGPFQLTLGPAAERQGEGKPFAIGEPAEEPSALLEAVTSFASGRDDVLNAWRALVRLESEAPQPLIGVELAAGADPDEVLPLLISHLDRERLGPFIAVPVDRDAPDPFAEYLLSNGTPFWRGGAAP